MISDMLKGLTPEQKIGQLFVTGFPGTEPSEEFLGLVGRWKIGNVILFSHNIEGKRQLASLNGLLRALITRETGIPPFISIDEEGGVVSRLPEGTAVLPSAMAQASLGDEALIRRGARMVGEELAALGINFNLAPVLDINSNPLNPVIGVRSFGEDPETVSRFALSAVQGCLDAGILCSGKHFPGHGDTTLDSHLALPLLDAAPETLEQRELAPFRRLIREGLPAVTAGHIAVPALDASGLPCTLSRRVVTGLLRGKMGFRGLIISDCMEMNAIKEYCGVGEGAVQALLAGVDLIFISHTAAAVEEAAEAVKKAVEEGRLPVERIDDAVGHILRAKEKFVRVERTDPSRAGTEEQLRFASEFLDRTIVPCGEAGRFLPGNKPLFVGVRPHRVTLASSREDGDWDFASVMQEKFGGVAVACSQEPSREEISKAVRAAADAACVVLGTLNGHLSPGQRRLAQSLGSIGKPAALVALRNPYDLDLLPGAPFRLALYEYSRRTLEAAAKFFE